MTFCHWGFIDVVATFIGLFIVCHLSTSGLWGQQPEQGNQDDPLPKHFHQLLRGDNEIFPRAAGRYNLSSVSLVYPGLMAPLGVSPATRRRKLILVACIFDLILSFTSQSSLP